MKRMLVFLLTALFVGIASCAAAFEMQVSRAERRILLLLRKEMESAV